MIRAPSNKAGDAASAASNWRDDDVGPDLLGYTLQPVVAPGEDVSLCVSCHRGSYDVQLVRLVSGDESIEGPGFKEVEIDAPINGRRAGRLQVGRTGSAILLEDRAAFADLQSFVIAFHVHPTSSGNGREQMIFSRRTADLSSGGAIGINGEGRLTVWSGSERVLVASHPLAAQWSHVLCSYDATSGALALRCTRLKPEGSQSTMSVDVASATFSPAPAGTPVVIAATQALEGLDAHFNGRLEDVCVLSGHAVASDLALDRYGALPELPVVARWDFSKEMDGSRAVDVGPHAAHGKLLQNPARAIPGHRWTGREVDHRLVPDEYAAIHFHDDDVSDLGWDVDLEMKVPRNMPSGVYAFRLSDGVHEDHVPFFVRPARGRANGRIALLIPTFSYLAYANERISSNVDFVAAGMTDRTLVFDPLERVLERHPEFGVSMYDHHSDGSGVIHSSWRRPILNLRPRYRWWLSGAPQYLGCDLYIVDWLTRLGEPFDVVTDHCLHEEGAELLARYDVVVTSSHPEYCSYGMMSALEEYTSSGGRLMYLGGNGFYWVTSLDPEKPYVIEVRRGMAGTRAWESAPGEEHHSTTGERGGLWRHRGWAPNRIAGVGFAAQGWSRRSPGYRVNEQARSDPATRWIFEGVGEEIIGDFGLIMGGAAGDELDRADPALGSPSDLKVLASSGGHGRYYLQVHEDAPFSHAGLGGDVNPNVRADLVYYETAGGGAVFSVGSKAWAGSLPWNDYDNNVARLTSNVLIGMLRGAAAGATSE